MADPQVTTFIIIGVIIGLVILIVAACLDFFADMDLKGQYSSVNTVVTAHGTKDRVGSDSGSETSSLLEDGDMIKTDMALMDTFVNVLTQGIVLRVHCKDGKQPKEARMILENKTIVWQSVVPKGYMGFSRSHKIDITNIRQVFWGKSTPTFENMISQGAPVDNCLSLITFDNNSLDIEFSSRVERDSFAQGFTLLVQNLNGISDVDSSYNSKK